MALKFPVKTQARAKRHPLVMSLAKTLREQFFVHAGERIGIGVSGGADSVALLQLLVELREELGIVPGVLHFNHELRGSASEKDEKFVAKLAAEHGLEFFVARENIAAKAKRERANLEDAARRARYEFFERVVKEQRFSRIAVAHTADDQAETVLAHILRGTGLAGLGGIHPEVGNVFRPVLGFRRAALRNYLRSKRQAWREDKSNRDELRTRSRIRHQLLPFLEKKFTGSAVEHLCQLAELAREDSAYLDHMAALRSQAIAEQSDSGISLPLRDLVTNEKHAIHRAMAKRLVREIVKRVKPRAGEWGSRHLEAVLDLAQQGHSGKTLQLPGGVEVRRKPDALVFCAASAQTSKMPPKTYSFPVALPALAEELRLDALSHILHLRVIDWPCEGRETNKTGALLDRDRLRSPLVIRNWRPGDAMQPQGHQKRHTLARLLNEMGLSRWEKESWPVLTSGEQVAWALGLPVAEEFALVEGSSRALVITEESSL
jgi:tRNA(Ile)-lysidine synthase